jgi:septal ring factor EnvC (AmiA/AmiB activator)
LPELPRQRIIKQTNNIQQVARLMQSKCVRTLLTVLTTLSLSGLLFAGQTSPPQPLASEPQPVQPASHDLYNPARVALVNAERQLAESSRQEQDILERVQQMHKELESSLSLLAEAADKDPGMQQSITDIRNRLSALKDRPALCPLDNNSSIDVYGKVLADLQALIDRY